MSFLTSKGLKRRVVTYLALLADVLRSIPGAEPALPIIDTTLGLLGGSAVAHAGAAGTLSQEKIAGAVAALYALIALAPFVPALLPLLPFLYKATGVLSALRVGKDYLE